MPLPNSHFRIVHRTKNDAHGVEGYFLHELLINPDGKVRSWKAGISLGAKSPAELGVLWERVKEAFKWAVIEHSTLTSGQARINFDPPPPSIPGEIHTHEIDTNNPTPTCISCQTRLCGTVSPDRAFACTNTPNHWGDHSQGDRTWEDHPLLNQWPNGYFNANPNSPHQEK